MKAKSRQVNLDLRVHITRGDSELVTISKRVMPGCHMSISIKASEVAPLVEALQELAGLDDDRARFAAKLGYIAAELDASPYCEHCAALWQRVREVAETR